MTHKHRTLAEIEEGLTRATNAHKDAKTRAEMAAREATAALNVVNTLQKELDAAIDALKKDAHGETDWRHQLRRRECAL